MSDVLLCPVCTSQVASTASMCRGCHLPIRDVAANQRRVSVGSDRAKWLRRRLFGLAVYGAVLAWCALQLPDAMVFVVPAVAAALWLHVVKGRPWLGALAFVALVALLPRLFWPALMTELLSDVDGWFD